MSPETAGQILSPSRGTTIITQKENKGEYNGNWAWNNSSYDWDIYTHVFDQTNSSGTPYRYASATSTGTCPSTDVENSTTLIVRAKALYGNNYQKIIKDQYSCKPNTLNAGNYYSFPAATAGSNNVSTSTETNMPNSICPKGWQLPPNSNNKSYNTLITTYSISAPASSDSTLRSNTAMSFARLGYYRYDNGSLYNRGNGGHYWSSTAYSSASSHTLNFGSGSLVLQDGSDRANGFSIRCVSR